MHFAAIVRRAIGIAVLMGTGIGAFCTAACDARDEIFEPSGHPVVKAQVANTSSIPMVDVVLTWPEGLTPVPDSALPRVKGSVMRIRALVHAKGDIHASMVRGYIRDIEAAPQTPKPIAAHRNCIRVMKEVGIKNRNDCDRLLAQLNGRQTTSASRPPMSVNATEALVGDPTGVNDAFPETYYMWQTLSEYIDYYASSIDDVADYISYWSLVAAYQVPDENDLAALLLAADTWYSSLIDWQACDSACFASIVSASPGIAANMFNTSMKVAATNSDTRFVLGRTPSAAAYCMWYDAISGQFYFYRMKVCDVARADAVTAFGGGLTNAIGIRRAISSMIIGWEAVGWLAGIGSLMAAVS